jgi:gliding motility-associated-like protein
MQINGTLVKITTPIPYFPIPIPNGTEGISKCPNYPTNCLPGSGGTFQGAQVWGYQAFVDIPPTQRCDQWIFSTELCCRNPGINNIPAPSDGFEIYYEAMVNTNFMSPTDIANGTRQNSPAFAIAPVPVVPVNQRYMQSPGTIETDGDSLYFTLVRPKEGGGLDINYVAGPGVSNVPPVQPIATNVVQPGIGIFRLDSLSGTITFVPSQLNRYVYVIQCDEWRRVNGVPVRVGFVRRDVQMVITNGTIPLFPGTNSLPQIADVNGAFIGPPGVPNNFQFSQFRVNAPACQTTCFNIQAQDLVLVNGVRDDLSLFTTDSLNLISSNPSLSLPYTKVRNLSSDRPRITFCFTPQPIHLRNHPYLLTALVRDDFGVSGETSVTFSIFVAPGGFANAGVDLTSCSNSPVTLNVQGGQPGATYNWFPTIGLSDSTSQFPTLNPQLCTAQIAANIVEPTPLNAAVVGVTDARCNAQPSGTISIQASGGTPPYSYSRDGVSFVGTPLLSNVPAGTYTITVRDARLCTFVIPGTVTINQPAPLTASSAVQNITCNGFNNGQVTITPSGGTPPYRFNGPQGIQTSNVFPNLVPNNNYSFTVTDFNNCNVTISNVPVTQPAALTFSRTRSNPVGACNASNGSITVTIPAGGVAPYAYSIDGTNFGTGTTFSNLGTGRYVVYMRDANNCIATAVDSLPLAGAVRVNAFTATPQVTCNGLSNGEINITQMSPAAGAFQYALNGGTFGAISNFTGLPAGHHQIVARNTNDNCSTTLNVRIIAPRAVTASIVNVTDVACFGLNTGNVRVSAGGGTGALSFALNAGAFGASPLFGSRPAGIDTIRVRDANLCQVNIGVTIAQPSAALAAVASSLVSPQCFGELTGSFTMSATGGTPPYQFTRSGGPNQTNGNFTSVPPGLSNVTVRDNNNCIVNVPVTLTAPTLINATSSVIPPTNCSSANGVLTVTATTGGTGPYSYSIDGTTFGAATSFPNLANGRYNLFIRDANNCTRVQNVPVVAPNGVSALANVTNISCNGQSNGSVSITGGTGGFGSYAFSSTGTNFTTNNTFPNQAGGNRIFFVRDRLPDTLTLFVTVTNPDGCNAQDTLRVFSRDTSINVTINGGVDSVVFCRAGSVQLNASGAEIYTWSPPTGLNNPGIANPLASPTTTTVYTVTGTSGSCSDTKTIRVVVDNPNPLTVTNDTGICRGQSLQLSASGGTTYQWTPNVAITGANTCCPTVNPLLGTIYRVRSLSPTGCESIDSVRVEVRTSAEPVVTLSRADANGIICLGDTQEITLNVFQPEILTCGPNLGVSNCAFGSVERQLGNISGIETSFPAFTRASQGVRQQYLIRAGELQGIGLGAGDISSVSFFASDVPLNFDTLRNFSIKLKCMPTSFNQFNLLPATPPATGSVPKFEPAASFVYARDGVVIQQGQNKFNFDNSYYWDGQSNLIVELCYYSTNPAIPNSSAPLFIEQTGFFATVLNVEANNPFVCTKCELDGTERRTTRPIMTFEACKFDKNFYVYSWSNTFNTAGIPLNVASGFAVFKDTTNTDTWIVPTDTGAYAFGLSILDAFGCSSDTIVDTLKVIERVRDVVTNNDTAVCFDEEVKLKARATAATNYQWVIPRPGGAPLSSTTDTIVFRAGPSDTRLRAIVRADNQGECFVNDTVLIRVGVDFRDKIDIGGYQAYYDALFDVTIPPNDTVIAGLENGGSTKTEIRDIAPLGVRFVNQSINPDSIWQWAFSLNGGSPVNFSNQIAPSYIFGEAGDYLVIATALDSVGCKASDSLLVIVERFLLPNVITPNNDGKNDTFLVSGLRPGSKTKLDVFNRWGRPVYSRNEYDNTFDGKDLEGGTYFYSLFVEEQAKTYTGWIQLIK